MLIGQVGKGEHTWEQYEASPTGEMHSPPAQSPEPPGHGLPAAPPIGASAQSFWPLISMQVSGYAQSVFIMQA